jgi:hypothetical protein
VTAVQILTFVRRGLLAVLLIGIVGMSVIPLALALAALGTTTWITIAPSPGAVAAVKVVMAGFVAAGLVGVVLHMQANAEFQREIDPALSGADLFWKVVQAKAPPALAPGVMVQLGLVGWLFAVMQDGRLRDAS